MHTAYLYSRYSSPAQAKGDSSRRQLVAATSFAESNNLTLDTSLKDEGVSGFTGRNRTHGALGSFLKRVQAGEIAKGSYLLLDSIDRLSRESMNQVAHMLTAITLAGIKIVNLSDGQVFDEGADLIDWIRFLVHVERANAESKEKGRKVSAAHEAGRVRARTEKTPYTPVGPHWLLLVDKGWQEKPDRVAIMRRIFDIRENGLGYTAIAQTLNKEGVPTATGRGHWASSTVRDYLRSRSVLGEYQPFASPGHGQKLIPQGDPIEGFYPPIISVEQFYRVQAIASGRRHPKAAPRSRKFNNLLVGLATCGACKGPVGYAESTFPKKAHWKVNGVLLSTGVQV
jgi:DNA invertase Pin-like site-specific DNA recombinase